MNVVVNVLVFALALALVEVCLTLTLGASFCLTVALHTRNCQYLLTGPFAQTAELV